MAKKDLDLAVTSRDETHQIEYNNIEMLDKLDNPISSKPHIRKQANE